MKDAYMGTSERQDMDRFKYDGDLSDDRTAVYHDGGQSIIAYRGTVPTDVKDLWDDTMIVLGKESWAPGYRKALAKYDQVAKKYGNSITVTGHSLGGSKANWVSKKRDVHATVFNPGWGFGSRKADKTQIERIRGDPISLLSMFSGAKIKKGKSSPWNPHTADQFGDGFHQGTVNESVTGQGFGHHGGINKGMLGVAAATTAMMGLGAYAMMPTPGFKGEFPLFGYGLSDIPENEHGFRHGYSSKGKRRAQDQNNDFARAWAESSRRAGGGFSEEQRKIMALAARHIVLGELGTPQHHIEKHLEGMGMGYRAARPGKPGYTPPSMRPSYKGRSGNTGPSIITRIYHAIKSGNPLVKTIKDIPRRLGLIKQRVHGSGFSPGGIITYIDDPRLEGKMGDYVNTDVGGNVGTLGGNVGTLGAGMGDLMNKYLAKAPTNKYGMQVEGIDFDPSRMKPMQWTRADGAEVTFNPAALGPMHFGKGLGDTDYSMLFEDNGPISPERLGLYKRGRRLIGGGGFDWGHFRPMGLGGGLDHDVHGGYVDKTAKGPYEYQDHGNAALNVGHAALNGLSMAFNPSTYGLPFGWGLAGGGVHHAELGSTRYPSL